MPYITERERENFDGFIEEIQSRINTWGQLNYVVTRITLDFFLKLSLDLGYDRCQAMKGFFRSLSDEFENRVMGPYEKMKCALNGDIPEYRLVDIRLEELRGNTEHQRFVQSRASNKSVEAEIEEDLLTDENDWYGGR